jgi:hypothetical protein
VRYRVAWIGANREENDTRCHFDNRQEALEHAVVCNSVWSGQYYHYVREVVEVGETDMVGCDFDGTLVSYMGEGFSNVPEVNETLLEVLRGKHIWIVTNQGGLPFGIQWLWKPNGKPKKYPLPHEFIDRLVLFHHIALAYNVTVIATSVCFYHPHATAEVMVAAHDTTVGLSKTLPFPLYTYLGKEYRKPQGGMVKNLGLAQFIGDGDEDENLALHEGIPFVRIDRFVNNE